MKKGFTLLETLVVIVIIGILITVGVMSFAGMGKSARDTKRMDDMHSLQKAFELHYQMKSAYPTGGDAGTCFGNLAGVITTAVHVTDPDTGSDYSWECNSQSYCICAAMEAQSGNSLDDSCSFAQSGTRTHYCVRNTQTIDAP